MTPGFHRSQFVEVSRSASSVVGVGERPARRRAISLRRTIPVLAAVAAIALAVAACGGGPDSPGVAGSPSHSHSGTTSGHSNSSASSTYTEALRYTRCMRSHGVPDFPDPNSDGTYSINPGSNSDLNNDRPALQAASQDCRRYRPVISLSPAQHAHLETEYLAFAHCMRSHGIADFPDPVTGSGDGVGFHFQGGPNSDLSSTNPAYLRAVASCQHILGHQFHFAFGANGGKGA